MYINMFLCTYILIYIYKYLYTLDVHVTVKRYGTPKIPTDFDSVQALDLAAVSPSGGAGRFGWGWGYQKKSLGDMNGTSMELMFILFFL